MRTHWCLRFRHNHVCSTLHQQEEFLAGHVCELANRTCGHFEMAVVQGTSEIYLVMSNPHYKQLPVDQILSFGCVSVGVWKRFLQNCSFHLLVIALFFGCSKSIFILKLMVDRNGSVSKPCTPVVHIKIAGKWMFIPLKMVLIGIDPYPNGMSQLTSNSHPTTSVLDTCMGWHGSLDICGHVHPSCRVVLGQPGLATLSQFSHDFFARKGDAY